MIDAITRVAELEAELEETYHSVTQITNELEQAKDVLRVNKEELIQKILDLEEAKSLVEEQNRIHVQLAQDLSEARDDLESALNLLTKKNEKLAELYDTAHQFVDNVSHEFRTPLTVIKEFASILWEGLAGGINDDQKEYLGIIITRVDDLSIMVSDMLDISKIEANMLGVHRKNSRIEDIIEHVKTTLERKASANNIKFTIDTPAGIPHVYCDAEKIGRAIINLAVNAFKFTDAGGKVVLWVCVEGERPEVKVGITDNGHGFSPEKVGSIFRRFQQLDGDIKSSTKGFGLGLSIVKELVHLNFGDIIVESEVGKGSTFAFTVPIANPMKVLERYLSRVDSIRDGSSFASLITARVESGATADQVVEVERFLECQFQRNDLLYRPGSDTWLVVAAVGPEDIDHVIDRANNSRIEINRNRPGEALPTVHLQGVGCWHVHNQRTEFLKRFEAAWDAAAGTRSSRKRDNGQRAYIDRR